MLRLTNFNNNLPCDALRINVVKLNLKLSKFYTSADVVEQNRRTDKL